MKSFNYNSEVSLEEAKQILDIEEGVQKKLQQKGFIMATKPAFQDSTGASHYFDGTIPHDLTQLNDQQLGFYMSMVTAWMDWVGCEKTLYDMSRTVAQAQLDVFESKLRLKNKTDEEGKRRSNPERDDIVNADRHVLEARSKWIELDAMYSYINQQYKSAEQKYAALSRRVTQTTNEHSRHNRNINMANQRPTGGGNHQPFTGGRRR